MREVHRRLLDRGIAIQYTRYPGVGEAGALRAVVFSTHTAEQIEQEVLAHLRNSGAQVRVTLSIEVTGGEPFDESTMRTVSENCTTLGFESHDFEEET